MFFNLLLFPYRFGCLLNGLCVLEASGLVTLSVLTFLTCGLFPLHVYYGYYWNYLIYGTTGPTPKIRLSSSWTFHLFYLWVCYLAHLGFASKFPLFLLDGQSFTMLYILYLFEVKFAPLRSKLTPVFVLSYWHFFMFVFRLCFYVNINQIENRESLILLELINEAVFKVRQWYR